MCIVPEKHPLRVTLKNTESKYLALQRKKTPFYQHVSCRTAGDKDQKETIYVN